MRKIILGTVLGLMFSIGAYTSAKAEGDVPPTREPIGGWVKVDASGNAISGATVCTYSVCGDPSSLFNKLTLNAGEQWVKQTVADPVTGNVVGIGNNNPNTTVTYDRPSETFTIVNEPQPQSTNAAPQPTSEPSSPPATGVEPTSNPQPAPEATSQPAPEATPAPPVVGQPTQTSVPPVVVEPTPTPEPVVPIVVPIIVPTVDPNVIPNTYEWKLSDNNGEFRWQPKRRSLFSGEQQAI